MIEVLVVELDLVDVGFVLVVLLVELLLLVLVWCIEV